jgi:hypothetical protein
LKPDQENSLGDLISKMPYIKKGWQNGSSDRAPELKCEALSSSPCTAKNQKKQKPKRVLLRDLSCLQREDTGPRIGRKWVNERTWGS